MSASAALPALPKSETSSGGILPGRLTSIDAYRGFVMFLIMAQVLHLIEMAEHFPLNSFWQFLGHHQDHVQWVGCILHDIIQPSFTFLVGVVLPFSIASRLSKHQTKGQLVGHAMGRSLILILLGIFLRSLDKTRTYFTFEDTLTQIGLGYAFVFFLAWRSVRVQWVALALILVGYWAAFVIYPAPNESFPYAKFEVSADKAPVDKWPADKTYAETKLWNENVHLMPGFASHWNKNSNLAWKFDTWFLNLFPREKNEPFTAHPGGYATLSFIPTLGTMILGLIAGGILISGRGPWRKALWLVALGMLCLALGSLVHWYGICPIVKRIWTPSWTLFSGGLCLLLLAAFYTVIDIWRFRRWAFPWVVIGMNSIAAYCMAEYLLTGGDSPAPGWIERNLKIHLGQDTFKFFDRWLPAGQSYEPVVVGVAIMLVIWLFLYYMYRQKVFLKI
jgi:heparan-alpha-glucosaminide N-acetyltransferase